LEGKSPEKQRRELIMALHIIPAILARSHAERLQTDQAERSRVSPELAQVARHWGPPAPEKPPQNGGWPERAASTVQFDLD
jgi:hypothetical protein